MNNIFERLSRQPGQPGQPERYKKFNPNPTPTQTGTPIQSLPPTIPFPAKSEWETMGSPGGLELAQYANTTGVTDFSGFITQQPTPTEMPPEGLTETGYPDVLNQIMGTYGIQDPMEALQLYISMSAGEQERLGYEPTEEEEEEKPVIFPETKEEFIDQKIKEGMKAAEVKGLANLIYPEEEAPTPTPMDIMTMGKEQGFTTQDEYIGALMGEAGMDYNEALTFYQTFSGSHPDYPRDY